MNTSSFPMDLLRHYPIYPGFCFLLYGSYVIPVILLLVVLQRSTIQYNCRIVLTAWGIGMMGILLDEMVLMIVNLTPLDGEFISKKLQDPPYRPYIHVVHSMCYMSTSALELLFAVERTIAFRTAKLSEENRTIFRILIPSTGIYLPIAAYLSKRAYIDFEMMTISATYISIEILSIIATLCIYYYCKRRYNSMLGRSSLTEPYHIRETFLLSSAMFPVNVCGFSIKFSAAIVCWIYTLYYEVLPYFALEFVYQGLHATNCAVCAIILVRGHPRLRRECLKIMKRWCCRSIEIKDDTTNSAKNGNKYFEMLAQSWN